MPGGKGKSTGGKAGPKAPEGKSQKSHSAKAGLQVSDFCRGLRDCALYPRITMPRVDPGSMDKLCEISDRAASAVRVASP